ncbi:MAG: hypothetical protein AAGF11_22125 [Myxococcota bacterium]
MSGLRTRYTTVRWIGSSLLFALCACDSAPPPKPAPKAPAPKAPAPAPTPEPAPDPPPTPPDLPVADERCKVTVDGGPKIKRAFVKVQEGGLQEGEVEDGYTVGYDCSDEDARKKIDLIADLETDKVVHWKDVEVGSQKQAKVVVADAKEGLPELTPEELEELQQKGWSIPEEPAAVPADKPKRVKMPVVFMQHQLNWAQIQIKGKGKKPQTVTINGKRRHPLYPGKYEVLVRKSPEGELQSAGSLTIEPGKSHTVKLLKRPLSMQVTSVKVDAGG